MRKLETNGALGQDIDSLGPCVLSAAELALCRDAETVLERAQSRAARWEAAGRARYATALSQARKAGHEEGIANAASEIAAQSDRLDTLKTQEEARARALAGEIMQALFAGLDDGDRIAAATRRALSENADASGASLAVHPKDLSEVTQRLNADQVKVVPDGTLQPGVARLDTVLGAIHLSPDRQLSVVTTLLKLPEPEGDT